MTEHDSLLEQLRRIDPAAGEDEMEARMRAKVNERGRAALEGPAPKGSERRWRPRLALASGLAVAAGFGAVLVGGIGDEKLNVVEEARAALPGPGELVHFVAVTTFPGADGAESSPGQAPDDRLFAPRRYEQWSTEGRWRVARDNGTVFPQMFAGEPFIPGTYIPDEELGRVGLDREITGPTQEAYANGVDSLYVDGADVIVRVDLPASNTLTRSSPGGLFSGTPNPVIGSDPVEALRDQLDRGALRDAGTAEFDGRTVRRLVSGQGAMEYLVDAETFEPVRITWGSGPGGESTVFEEYETLPLDETTESLLELDVPRGTAEIEALGPDEQPPRSER